MSHIKASSQPPPRACPETAAMMGFFMVVMRDQGSMKEVLMAWEKVRVDISLMSAPAAKALGEPVRIMEVIVGESLRVWRAAFSSVKRGVERALRALGRLRVICPTPGAGSEVRMCS